MCNAFIDTESQILLVVEASLTRRIKIKRKVINIHGVTGNVMETRGQTELSLGETSPHDFMVVSQLPMDCNVLIRQDWLERFGYQFQIPNLGIKLPACSETLIRIPTSERGTRLIEAQELQENVFCASIVVECVDSSFVCLVMNCNPTDEVLKTLPQTQELPKLSSKFVETNKREHHVRNQLLQAQLRLAHLKEGEREIRFAQNMWIFLNYQEID